ncbi:hypothetical protein JW887_05795 [Candidatus Dojkabacteria bacterium]|nr:hypothetical protein [Candidatus Dojkabacteria bacterium]
MRSRVRSSVPAFWKEYDWKRISITTPDIRKHSVYVVVNKAFLQKTYYSQKSTGIRMQKKHEIPQICLDNALHPLDDINQYYNFRLFLFSIVIPEMAKSKKEYYLYDPSCGITISSLPLPPEKFGYVLAIEQTGEEQVRLLQYYYGAVTEITIPETNGDGSTDPITIRNNFCNQQSPTAENQQIIQSYYQNQPIISPE